MTQRFDIFEVSAEEWDAQARHPKMIGVPFMWCGERGYYPKPDHRVTVVNQPGLTYPRHCWCEEDGTAWIEESIRNA